MPRRQSRKPAAESEGRRKIAALAEARRAARKPGAHFTPEEVQAMSKSVARNAMLQARTEVERENVRRTYVAAKQAEKKRQENVYRNLIAEQAATELKKLGFAEALIRRRAILKAGTRRKALGDLEGFGKSGRPADAAPGEATGQRQQLANGDLPPGVARPFG